MIFDVGAEEVTLAIEGTEFRYWSSCELLFRFDGFDEASFTAPFDPDNAALRDLFRPFQLRNVSVRIAGEQVFAGTLMTPSPDDAPDRLSVTAECYSKAAVLADSVAPSDKLPLEFSGLTLGQVTRKIVDPWGISVEIDPLLEGAKFDKLKLERTDKIAPWLADLAKQRGLVLCSTPSGGIAYRQSAKGPGLPVARLEGGREPVTSVAPVFSTQDYYSEVTVVSKTKRGRPGAQVKIKNQRAPSGALRPGVIELDDTDPGDAKLAAEAALGRMLGSAATYDVNLATWLRPDGKIYRPNDRITLKAPRVMVYSETDFLVQTVRLIQNEEQEKTCQLGLVLPGTFSGEVPSKMPWDESGSF